VRTKKLSWIGLITFCTAWTILAALAMALIFASAGMMYAAAQSDPSDLAQSFSGIITDDHCGAKHQLTDRSPADCTRICVTKGSKYVLVDGDRIYVLQGDVVKLNRLAGERVTVVGSLHGHTIDFTSITDRQ
jgi:hypothetical protein